MKNIKYLLLSFLLMCVLVPVSVNAETIQDIRNKLSDLEDQKEEASNKSAQVQERIDTAKGKVNEISRQIADAKEEQKKTLEEIKELEKEIDKKKEQIKDLLVFYQVSENDNFYLKFIFGADSFEDLIYRFSVAEQLTEANDQLVDELNALVKKNEKKMKELKAEEKKLDALNAEMMTQIKKLGAQKEEYNKEGASYAEQIKLLKDQISTYKQICSSEYQDVTTCGGGSVSGSGGSWSGGISSSGFMLPTEHGCIEDGESEWGYSAWRGRLHAGIDVSCVAINTPVYAVQSGTVAAVTWWAAGGNVVMINHDNGYTSIYLHLNYTSVSASDVGKRIARGQQIGGAGGTGGYPVHLHMEIMQGHSGYSMDATVNPRSFINFPPTGGSW